MPTSAPSSSLRAWKQIGHTSRSSSLASTDARGDRVGEAVVHARLDAEGEEVGAREPSAFYCILLGHQDGVAVRVLEIARGEGMVVGERVRGEGEAERLQGREKPPGVADARDRVQPLAPKRVDGDRGAWLSPIRHHGRDWIEGAPGHRYTVRLTNTSPARVLVVLSVDGVNAVTGQTAHPSQAGYVLEPWQSTEVNGWRKSLDDVAQFVFTDLPDSYAARTGRPDNVGVTDKLTDSAFWVVCSLIARVAPTDCCSSISARGEEAHISHPQVSGPAT